MNLCIVQGCVGTSQLVKFPRNERKCREWLILLKQPRMYRVKPYYIRKYFRVCIDHFEDRFFEKLTILPKTLLPNAVPTLYINYRNSDSDTDSDANYFDVGSDYRTYFTDEYRYFKPLHRPNFQLMLYKAMWRMPKINKDCILQFEFLPIRTVTGNSYPTIDKTQALVFMLRGLYENWKQLVTYLYVDKPMNFTILAEYVCDAIYSTLLLNFNLIAVVCAPTSVAIKAMDLLSDNRNRIYEYQSEKFEHIPFRDKNILILYDPPQLLTQLRQEFIFMNLSYQMDYTNFVAAWTDIETVHEHRKQEKRQLLTDEHVYLPKMERKSVRHAAQVFSGMVGESLIDYADKNSKKNLATMRGTGVLLTFFNDLFDSVNGYQYKGPKHKPLYKKVSRLTNHYFFWEKSAKVLESMYFVQWNGKKIKTATLEKWQSTIYGMMELWNNLLSLNFNSFVPRRINLDPLDNDLSRIRYHHYYVEDIKWNASVLMKKKFYPDMEEFETAFRYVIENGANFLTPLYYTFLSPMHSDRSDLDFEKILDEAQFNCLEDNCSSILTICNFGQGNYYRPVANYYNNLLEMKL